MYPLLITGTGLTGASAVDFGTVSASFTVNSGTSITAVTPVSSKGMVNITVTTGNGGSATSAADQFTFTAASTPPHLGTSGVDAAVPFSIGLALSLVGLIIGGFALIARRRRAARYRIDRTLGR